MSLPKKPPPPSAVFVWEPTAQAPVTESQRQQEAQKQPKNDYPLQPGEVELFEALARFQEQRHALQEDESSEEYDSDEEGQPNRRVETKAKAVHHGQDGDMMASLMSALGARSDLDFERPVESEEQAATGQSLIDQLPQFDAVASLIGAVGQLSSDQLMGQAPLPEKLVVPKVAKVVEQVEDESFESGDEPSPSLEKVSHAMNDQQKALSSAGSPPIASGPPPIASGPPPIASGPPPIASGPPPIASGPPPIAGGPPPITNSELIPKKSEELPAGAPPVVGGPPPIAGGPPPIAGGPPPIAGGPPPFGVPPGGAGGGLHGFIPNLASASVAPQPEPLSSEAKKDEADEGSKNTSLVDIPLPKELQPDTEDEIVQPEEIEKTLTSEDLFPYVRMISDAFCAGISSWRHISRVAEYPIVRADGRTGDLAEIWPYLKGKGWQEERQPNGMLSAFIGDQFRIGCGSGRGIVEIQVQPQLDLHQVKTIHQDVVVELLAALDRRKMKLLGYGIQPKTAAKKELLTQIYHIFSLHRVIGDPWLVSSVMARDRVRISCGYGELIKQVNLGHLMEPLYLALFGNSSVFGGDDSYYPCARQLQVDRFDLEKGHVGMNAKAWVDVEDYIRHVLQRRFLLKRDPEGWLEPAEGRFVDVLEEPRAEQFFTDHLTFDWGPVGLCLEQGMIEWKAACQQPWNAHMAVSALSLGLMEVADEFLHFIDSFYPAPRERHPFGLTMADIMQREMETIKNPWPEFIQWRTRAIDHGLAKKEAFSGLIEGALQYAEIGLQRRQLGEEIYLQPLWDRLAVKMNPAQRLQRGFARFGMEYLLQQYTIQLEQQEEM